MPPYCQGACTAGVTCRPVRAKDEDAQSFYLCFRFEPSPTGPLHLVLLLKGIPASLASRRGPSGQSRGVSRVPLTSPASRPGPLLATPREGWLPWLAPRQVETDGRGPPRNA